MVILILLKYSKPPNTAAHLIVQRTAVLGVTYNNLKKILWDLKMSSSIEMFGGSTVLLYDTYACHLAIDNMLIPEQNVIIFSLNKPTVMNYEENVN